MTTDAPKGSSSPDTLNDVSSSIEKTVKALFDSTVSAATKALQDNSEAIETGKEAVHQGVQKGVELVRKYPLESAVACLGIGYLVGRLLSRRD